MYSGAETTDISVVTAKLKAGSGPGDGVGVGVGLGVAVTVASVVCVWVGWFVAVGETTPGVQAVRMSKARLVTTNKVFIAALYLAWGIREGVTRSSHDNAYIE